MVGAGGVMHTVLQGGAEQVVGGAGEGVAPPVGAVAEMFLTATTC